MLCESTPFVASLSSLNALHRGNTPLTAVLWDSRSGSAYQQSAQSSRAISALLTWASTESCPAAAVCCWNTPVPRSKGWGDFEDWHDGEFDPAWFGSMHVCWWDWTVLGQALRAG